MPSRIVAVPVMIHVAARRIGVEVQGDERSLPDVVHAAAGGLAEHGQVIAVGYEPHGVWGGAPPSVTLVNQTTWSLSMWRWAAGGISMADDPMHRTRSDQRPTAG